MNYAFVSDLHGDADSVKEMHRRYKDDRTTTAVFLGDYTDGRQGDNAEMVATLMKIANHEDFNFANEPIFLRGNHDEFIVQTALSNTAERYIAEKTWMLNGGRRTLQQLGYDELMSVRQFLNDNYAEYVQWLNSLWYVFETDLFYAVHAGLDMTLDQPRLTSQVEKVWVRENYYMQPNRIGKMMITGHTPTQTLGTSGNPIVLDRKDPHRYMIDGGVNSSKNKHYANVLTVTADGTVSFEKLTY